MKICNLNFSAEFEKKMLILLVLAFKFCLFGF